MVGTAPAARCAWAVIAARVRSRPGGNTEASVAGSDCGCGRSGVVTVATDQRGWGHPWHVPSSPPVSLRELAAEAAHTLGAPKPGLRRVPYPVLWAAGVVSPTLRELREVHYQFAEPFVIDATDATRTFGLSATPLRDAVAEMVAQPEVSATPGTR
jgi:hypothetical protein